MFLGIKDMLFAKGRFALMGSVVALITLLLVMLTGLTGGLGKQNTAALESFGADRYAFGTTGSGQAEVSFTNSSITAQTASDWKNTAGITSAEPIGFTQTKVEGNSSAAAAVVGVDPASSLIHDSVGSAVSGREDVSGQQVVLSETVATDTGVGVGDQLSIAGQEFTVAGISADTFYSHSPVVWASTESWQGITRQTHVSGDAAVVGTVLALKGTTDWEAAASSTHTAVTTVSGSFAGLAAFASEQGSLKTMQGFLYAISALVIISFLTVWTIQRTRDLAIVRALGGSTSYLMKDAISQAAIVLFIGAGLGLLVGWALGSLAANAVPFQLSALTLIGPALGIWVLGIFGSLIATARVSKIDPMIALGGN